MTWNVAHERLRYAAKVAGRFAGAADEERLGEYRALALGSVAQLRQCGLPALVAFYLSKKGAHRALLGDLFAWLGQAPMTRSIAGGGPRGERTSLSTGAGIGLLEALLQRNDSEQSQLATEAEAFLSDLRRTVEGVYQERVAASSSEEGAET